MSEASLFSGSLTKGELQDQGKAQRGKSESSQQMMLKSAAAEAVLHFNQPHTSR